MKSIDPKMVRSCNAWMDHLSPAHESVSHHGVCLYDGKTFLSSCFDKTNIASPQSVTHISPSRKIRYMMQTPNHNGMPYGWSLLFKLNILMSKQNLYLHVFFLSEVFF